MERFLALIISLLYITSSSGVVLNVHYCMGKVSSVKVDNFKQQFCKCGKKAADNSCCQTTFKVVKVSDAHNSVVAGTDYKSPLALPVEHLFQNRGTLAQATVITLPFVNSPPEPIGKIYIRNCVFRI